MKRLLYSFIFLNTHFFFGHGFGPSTLVRLDTGCFLPIEQVCKRCACKKKVLLASCCTNRCHQETKKVACAGYSQITEYVRLGFDEGYTECSEDDVVCSSTQELYLPDAAGWTPAYLIRPGDRVAAYNKTTVTVTFVQGIIQPITVYTVHVPDTQIFFVGKYSVMAHNTELSIAWSLAPGITSLSVGSVSGSLFAGPLGAAVGGILSCGLVLLAQKFFSQKTCCYKNRTCGPDQLPGILYAKNYNQKNNVQKSNLYPSPQQNNNKHDNDDDKDKHPNGTFIESSYHHWQSEGSKSPAPKNGQIALDKSVLIKNTAKGRVAVSQGEIVVLEYSYEGAYHGYVVNWDELVSNPGRGQEIINALVRNGLTTRSGKILL